MSLYFHVDLEEALQGAVCRRCNIGRYKANDIIDGTHLHLCCPIPKCGANARAPLPEVSKTIVYLDTSTISHMARALHRDETSSPWVDLYHVLKQAVCDEVICCPGSYAIIEEAELSTLGKEIVRLSREFGDPGTKTETQIRRMQMHAALDLFLRGDDPILCARPPRFDAFEDPVNSWRPYFSIYSRASSSAATRDSRRLAKERNVEKLRSLFEEYESIGLNYEAIRRRELLGYGSTSYEIGINRLTTLYRCQQDPEAVNSKFLLGSSDFEAALLNIQRVRGVDLREAIKTARAFFKSDYISSIPAVDIGARLYAALAIQCRGKSRRLPKGGDIYDIEHASTFIPYVDVFVADANTHNLCCQGNTRIIADYCTDIRRVGLRELESFIAYIGDLTARSDSVDVARRVIRRIDEDGYNLLLSTDFDRFLQDHQFRSSE